MSQSDTKKPRVVPVGLNFGPTWLSIVFFIDKDEYYTGVPCGALYQSFFQNTLNKEVQRNLEDRPSEGLSTSPISLCTAQAKATELVETFSNHIKSAVRMGVSALDYNPSLNFKVMAVTVPDHWGEFARTHVATATKLAGYPLDGSHMIIPLSRVIQSTYQMSRYNKGKYLTLLLDYNKSNLHLMLVRMCGTGCIIEGQVYFPHLGEDELHKAPILGSAAASSQESLDHTSVNDGTLGGVQIRDKSTENSSISDSPLGNLPTSDLPISDLPTSERLTSEDAISDNSLIERPPSGNPNDDGTAVPDEFYNHWPVCHNQAVHFKPIVDAVSESMVVMTAPEASSPSEKSLIPKFTFGEIRHAVRDVKYIVIDGEASIQGLRDLRDTIKDTFVNEEWINVEGNKRDCGAYGAALAAKRQLQNPKHLSDWKDLPEYRPGKAASRCEHPVR